MWSVNSCMTDEDDPRPINPYRSASLGGMGDQPDDYANYMNYNLQVCRNKFTQGQADRMRFVIEEQYTSFLKSEACLPPCENPVTASFDIQDTVIAGTVLTLSNLSTGGDGFKWYVDGESAGTTEDLTYGFNDAGIVQVTLVATSGDTYCKPDSVIKKVNVICPIEACFKYEIRNQYLSFSECDVSGHALEWLILKDDTKEIFSSAEVADSFYIKPYPFIKLCLTVDNGVCTHQHCRYINTTGTYDEICDNGQDDDGDGLIDGFDPDCPCSGTTYYNHCKPDCEAIPEVFPDIKMKLKWQSEVLAKDFNLTSAYVVGDISGDDIPEIITFYGTGINKVKNYIGIFDGLTGVLLDTIDIFPEYNLFHLLLHPAILSNKQNSKKYICNIIT